LLARHGAAPCRSRFGVPPRGSLSIAPQVRHPELPGPPGDWRRGRPGVPSRPL